MGILFVAFVWPVALCILGTPVAIALRSWLSWYRSLEFCFGRTGILFLAYPAFLAA